MLRNQKLPIGSKKEQKILEFLKKINKEVKIKMLICDWTKEHLGKDIKQWCESEYIKLHATTPYHHQSNGKIERFHRTLMDGLNKAKEKGSYDNRLQKVVSAYNNSWHSAIKMTPMEANNSEKAHELKQSIYQEQLRRALDH